MLAPFVGEGRARLLEAIAASFEDVVDTSQPLWWSLEANTGWGKTRIVQELYGHLARERQPELSYWPPSLAGADDGPATDSEVRMQQFRKRVHPADFHPPGDVLPHWFWWGISCDTRAGTPIHALANDLDQFALHRTALERRFNQLSTRLQRGERWLTHRRAEIGEAAMGEAISAAATAASLAVPGLGLLVLAGKWGVKTVSARAQDQAEEPVSSRLDLVDEIAPWLARFAYAGIPLVIVIEDLHLADEALVEVIARLLGATGSPVLVITTAWRGLLDEPSRAAHVLLDRVPAEHIRRMRGEDDIGSLSAADLGAIARAALPTADAESIDVLTARYPNPCALLLACQTRSVQRSIDRRTLTDDTVATLPSGVAGLYRLLWLELPQEIRRVLMVAAMISPGSISQNLLFDDARWDRLTLETVVEHLGWLSEEVGETARHLVDGEAYAWVRSAGEWLQRFHEPGQHSTALEAIADEYTLDDRAEVMDACAGVLLAAEGAGMTPERELTRDRVLVALAWEGFVPWTTTTLRAALSVCDDLLSLPGVRERRLVADIVPMTQTTDESPLLLELRDRRAMSLGELGRVEDAVAEYTTLVEAYERAGRQDDPDALTARSDLAYWQGEAGGLQEAIRGHRNVLEARLRILGPDHPDVLTSQNNLASTEAAAGRLDDAIDTFVAIVADAERILGPDHLHTLEARGNLAVRYGEEERWAEAIDALTALVIDRERVQGREHPDIVATRVTLTTYEAEVAGPACAVKDLKLILLEAETALGPTHPQILRIEHDLACLEADAGEVRIAIERLERLLPRGTAVFGPRHPNILLLRNTLATCRLADGDHDGALTALAELAIDCQAALGEDHPLTRRVKDELSEHHRRPR